MKKNKNLTTEIMSKIQKNEVEMKSKKYFLVKEIGLKTSMIIIIALTVIAINFSLYYFVNSDYFWEFRPGIPGLKLLLRNIPFGFILFATIGLVITRQIWHQFDISYKKPYTLFMPILTILVIVLGIVIFKSGLNERLGTRMGQRMGPRMEKRHQLNKETYYNDIDYRIRIPSYPNTSRNNL